MIKFTTTLYALDRPNANKRIYGDAFHHINSQELYPIFLSEEPRMEDLVGQARVYQCGDSIEIETLPLCNNWKQERQLKTLSEAFSKGHFAIVPSGYGEMIYDPNKDCYIVKDYRLDHFYITNQPAFKYESKMEVV